MNKKRILKPMTVISRFIQRGEKKYKKVEEEILSYKIVLKRIVVANDLWNSLMTLRQFTKDPNFHTNISTIKDELGSFSIISNKSKNEVLTFIDGTNMCFLLLKYLIKYKNFFCNHRSNSNGKSNNYLVPIIDIIKQILIHYDGNTSFFVSMIRILANTYEFCTNSGVKLDFLDCTLNVLKYRDICRCVPYLTSVYTYLGSCFVELFCRFEDSHIPEGNSHITQMNNILELLIANYKEYKLLFLPLAVSITKYSIRNVILKSKVLKNLSRQEDLNVLVRNICFVLQIEAVRNNMANDHMYLLSGLCKKLVSDDLIEITFNEEKLAAVKNESKNKLDAIIDTFTFNFCNWKNRDKFSTSYFPVEIDNLISTIKNIYTKEMLINDLKCLISHAKSQDEESHITSSRFLLLISHILNPKDIEGCDVSFFSDIFSFKIFSDVSVVYGSNRVLYFNLRNRIYDLFKSNGHSMQFLLKVVSKQSLFFHLNEVFEILSTRSFDIKGFDVSNNLKNVLMFCKAVSLRSNRAPDMNFIPINFFPSFESLLLRGDEKLFVQFFTDFYGNKRIIFPKILLFYYFEKQTRNLRKRLREEKDSSSSSSTSISLNYVDTFLRIFTIILGERNFPYMDYYFAKYKLLEMISMIAKIDVLKQIGDSNLPILHDILRCYHLIYKKFPERMKEISYIYVNSICIRLPVELGIELVDTLVYLAFDTHAEKIYNASNTSCYRLYNPYVLYILHRLTINNAKLHSKIFTTVYYSCCKSDFNKYQIYISNFIEELLIDIEKCKHSESSKNYNRKYLIQSSMNIFDSVLKYMFKMKYFYGLISTIKSNDNEIFPWTNDIISLLKSLLEYENTSGSPNSYFILNGRDSYIYLPKISDGLVKGFSLRFKFMLKGINSDDNKLLAISFSDKVTYIVYVTRDNEKSAIFLKFMEDSYLLADGCNDETWYTLILSFHGRVVNYFIGMDDINGTFASLSLLKSVSSFANMRVIIGNSLSLFIESITLYSGSSSSHSSLKNLDQICHFSAKFVYKNKCYNCVRNAVGDADVRCSIVPFSTPFLNVIAELGGVKQVLPLLNLSTSEETLGNVIDIIALLFKDKKDIQDLFCEEKICSSFAYLLGKVKPEIVSENVVKKIYCIYNEASKESKISLIENILFNPKLWKELNIRSFANAAICELSMSSEYIKFVLNIFSIKNLLILITEEEDDETRKLLWNIFTILSDYGFGNDDKSFLFELLKYSNISSPCVFEILSLIYDHSKAELEKMGGVYDSTKKGFIRYIDSHGIDLFVNVFLKNQTEAILILVYKIVFFNKRTSKRSSSEQAYFYYLDQTIGCTLETYDNLWLYLVNEFFNVDSERIYILYLISHFSHRVPKENVLTFLKSFAEKTHISSANSTQFIESIISHSLWMLALFNIYLYTNDDMIHKIYSDFGTYFLQNEKSGFSRILLFFYYMQTLLSVDLSLFLKNMYLYLLENYTSRANPPDESKSYFIQCVFEYLFLSVVISDENSELPHEAVSRTKYTSERNVKIDFNFNQRLTTEWTDQNVAKLFFKFICKNHRYLENMYQNENTLYMGIVCLLVGYLIRYDIDILDDFIKIASRKKKSLSIFILLFYQYTSLNVDFKPKFEHFWQTIDLGGHDIVEMLPQLRKSYDDFYDVIFNHMNNLTEFYSSCAKELCSVEEFKPKTKHIKGELLDQVLGEFHSRFENVYEVNKKHWELLSENIYKYNTPWSRDIKVDPHFKHSIRYDKRFRRVFILKNAEILDYNQPYENFDSAYFENDVEAGETVIGQDSNLLETDCMLITNKQSIPLIFALLKDTITLKELEKESALVCINYNDIVMVLLRNHGGVSDSIEIFLRSGMSYYVRFIDKNLDEQNTSLSQRDFEKVVKKRKVVLTKLRQLVPKSTYIQEKTDKVPVGDITEKWINGEISNYEYLLRLNFYSGRSFNSLVSYPCLPNIFKNYSSGKFDMTDLSNLRDFNYPCFCQTEQARNQSISKFEESGAHNQILYSTQYYVIWFMVRLQPYTHQYYLISNNKFDERLFKNISQLNSGSVDLELIPEIFTTPNIYTNCSNIPDFHDVKLPAWALSAEEFTARMKQALESEYVSKNLHLWIDLIFGVRSRGKLAEQYCNTYSLDVANSDFLSYRERLLKIGSLPNQIFKEPHKKRRFLESKYQIFKDFRPLDLDIKNVQFLFFKKNIFDIYMITKEFDVYCYEAGFSVKRVTSVQSLIPPQSKCIFRSFLYHPKLEILAVSSPLDNNFTLLNLNKLSSPVFKEECRVSRILGLIGQDDSIVSFWEDSLIVKYQYNQNKDKSTFLTKVYTIIPHSSPIVDCSVSVSLDMIASVDMDRFTVLSRLSDGLEMDSFRVNYKVQELVLFDEGYIVFLCNHDRKLLCVHHINGKRVRTLNCPEGEIRFKHAIVSFDIIQLHGIQQIVLAFDDKSIRSYSVPFMEEIFTCNCDSDIERLYYHNNLLYIVSKGGRLYYCK